MSSTTTDTTTTTHLLTETEAAVRLGLSKRTLQKLRYVGGGPAFCKLGKAVRYRPADLEAWIEAGVRTSTSDTGRVRDAA